MAAGFLSFVWKQNFRFSVTRYCRCYNTMNSCLCSLVIQRLFSKSKIHGAVSLPHPRTIVSSINASLKDDQRGSSFKQERQIVLLVSETGTSLGQTSFEKAKEIARSQHMELVWINKDNKADMAVFKLMRKGHLLKKGLKGSKTKTVEVSDKIETRDLDFKLKQIRKMLEKGHQVRVALKTKRSNEGETAKWSILKRIEQDVEGIAALAGNPREDNPRQITCTFSPKKSESL
ncbi:translation initiation factor IF-3-like [Acropora palmata]|uniref:translation initiation factor IF-3-like n=1 Tax=Acropora palmata TaxID=6131 RepID=UPI003DA113E7